MVLPAPSPYHCTVSVPNNTALEHFYSIAKSTLLSENGIDWRVLQSTVENMICGLQIFFNVNHKTLFAYSLLASYRIKQTVAECNFYNYCCAYFVSVDLRLVLIYVAYLFQ